MTNILTFSEAAALLELADDEQTQILRLGAPDTGAVSTRAKETVRIAQALALIFAENQRVARWIRTPNAQLENRRGIDLLLSPEIDDLVYLRRHIEYWAYNGW